jgi:hypothetical protein
VIDLVRESFLRTGRQLQRPEHRTLVAGLSSRVALAS